MKLDDAWEHHRRHSTKLSDVVRQGALAGLALVWMFRTEHEGTPQFSTLLLAGAAVLVLGLIADACQYAVLSHSWKNALTAKQRELVKKHTKDRVVDHAAVVNEEFANLATVNKLGFTLFWLKVGLIIGGLVFVFVHIVAKVF